MIVHAYRVGVFFSFSNLMKVDGYIGVIFSFICLMKVHDYIGVVFVVIFTTTCVFVLRE